MSRNIIIYGAMDVACEMVNFAQSIGYPISNLKLQKELYFAQGYYLQAHGTPLFAEEISTWKYGPVVEKVYDWFQRYGSNFIPSTYEYLDLKWMSNDFEYVRFNPAIFEPKDLEFIHRIIRKLTKYSVSDLNTITMSQDPWINAKESVKKIIDKQLIRDYFQKRYRAYLKQNIKTQ